MVFFVACYFFISYNKNMEILAKLFGSQTRVKIMRLFLLNRDSNFESEEISSRSRVSKAHLRKEINTLMSINFIKQKYITREGARGGKKKISTWRLNPSFQYLPAIEDLLINPSILLQKDLASKFRPVGKVKLMLVSGVFIGEKESRVDIFLVCDKLNKKTLKSSYKKCRSRSREGARLCSSRYKRVQIPYRYVR